VHPELVYHLSLAFQFFSNWILFFKRVQTEQVSVAGDETGVTVIDEQATPLNILS
jgi:hypothetical protein